MRTDEQGRRLCSAHAKTGELCRAPAVTGANVCRMHGAARGTQARDAAEHLVLVELIGPALAVLRDAMEQAPWSVRIRAAIEVLARTGYSSDASDEPIPDHRLELEIARIESNMSEEELERHRRRAELSARLTDDDVDRILAALEESGKPVSADARNLASKRKH